MNPECQNCKDPTKYPSGCWDGPHGTHGAIFSCHNQKCPIAVERERTIAEGNRQRKENKAINLEAGVDTNKLRLLYLKKGTGMHGIAVKFGLRPPTMSDYMIHRKPFPPELYRQIMEWLGTLPDETRRENPPWIRR